MNKSHTTNIVTGKAGSGMTSLLVQLANESLPKGNVLFLTSELQPNDLYEHFGLNVEVSALFSERLTSDMLSSKVKEGAFKTVVIDSLHQMTIDESGKIPNASSFAALTKVLVDNIGCDLIMSKQINHQVNTEDAASFDVSAIGALADLATDITVVQRTNVDESGKRHVTYFNLPA